MQSIETAIESYRSAFAKFGDSPAAVLWPKGRQALRFRALTSHFSESGFSVLDYGCGLAHLKDYLDTRFSGFTYTGADMVEEFVRADRIKHPQASFQLVRGPEEIRQQYDYVVLSGVFNLSYSADKPAHVRFIEESLSHLFQCCRVSLSVDFMCDQVDFEESGSHYQNVFGLLGFVNQHLSRRYTLDQSYMPYEFSVTIYRDSSILRPQNIYPEAAVRPGPAA